MKKLLLFLTFSFVAIFPLIAQYVTDDSPLESFTLKKGNIPPKIIKAAEQLFNGSTQVEWGVFPYELKDYGWEINRDYNDPIDHYEIHLKMMDGSDAFAVFESTGELVAARMIRKNAPIPADIMKAIQTSEYKDWKVVGDIMKVQNNEKKGVDHFIVKVQNGDKKKNLYYTINGVPLANK